MNFSLIRALSFWCPFGQLRFRGIQRAGDALLLKKNRAKKATQTPIPDFSWGMNCMKIKENNVGKRGWKRCQGKMSCQGNVGLGKCNGCAISFFFFFLVSFLNNYSPSGDGQALGNALWN